jgi:hypothetical protein
MEAAPEDARTMIAPRYPATATPPAWITHLAATDQPAVTVLPTLSVRPAFCRFCPPHEPPWPADAELLWFAPGGLRREPVGPCCGVQAVHHLLGDVTHVTVLVHPGAAAVAA